MNFVELVQLKSLKIYIYIFRYICTVLYTYVFLYSIIIYNNQIIRTSV